MLFVIDGKISSRQKKAKKKICDEKLEHFIIRARINIKKNYFTTVNKL